jgi:beta-galactosidase/beta-glucuronidase
MDRVMSLAGNWRFQLDESNTGITNRWFDSVLADDITLPGSTDEAGFGTKNVKMDPHRLSRLYEYTGAAWYQKDITIPDAWVSKHISLYLERCHWETRVWVDGKEAGMQDSLCIPHEYDLSSLLSPGEHRLTIRVDNTIQYNVGINAHSITKETQTNWNGIVGDIRLKAADPVSVQNVQIFPNIRNRSVKVSVALQNDTDETVSGRLILIARSFQAETVHQPAELTIPFIAPKGLAAIETVYLLGEGVQLWDEFFPVLYTLNVKNLVSSPSSGWCGPKHPSEISKEQTGGKQYQGARFGDGGRAEEFILDLPLPFHAQWPIWEETHILYIDSNQFERTPN